MLCLTIAEAAVLLLPFDAANKGGIVGCGDWDDSCGEMRFEMLWQILFFVVLILIAVFIPFFMIYYESDTTGTGIETTGCSKFSSAICYTGGSIIVWVLVIIIGAFVFNKAYVPYSDCLAEKMVDVVFQSDGSYLIGTSPSYGVCKEDTLGLPVSFIVTTIGMLTFVGWFCLAFFGGIGLPALPIDMIRSFIFRPKLISKSSFVDRKKQLDAKLRDMMEVAEQLKDEEEGISKIPGFMARRKAKSAHSTAVKQLKQSVYLIEQEYIDVEASYIAYKKYNPLVPFCKLIMGILGIIITLLWILQIGLYVVPRQINVIPPTTFLNVLLKALDELSVIFGCVVFGVFVIYLMFCAIKGVFKFGLRFFCLSIHPMVLGRTSIVTFIFNLTYIHLIYYSFFFFPLFLLFFHLLSSSFIFFLSSFFFSLFLFL